MNNELHKQCFMKKLEDKKPGIMTTTYFFLYGTYSFFFLTYLKSPSKFPKFFFYILLLAFNPYNNTWEALLYPLCRLSLKNPCSLEVR